LSAELFLVHGVAKAINPPRCRKVLTIMGISQPQRNGTLSALPS